MASAADHYECQWSAAGVQCWINGVSVEAAVYEQRLTAAAASAQRRMWVQWRRWRRTRDGVWWTAVADPPVAAEVPDDCAAIAG
jgi:hypothetical protein